MQTMMSSSTIAKSSPCSRVRSASTLASWAQRPRSFIILLQFFKPHSHRRTRQSIVDLQHILPSASRCSYSVCETPRTALMHERMSIQKGGGSSNGRRRSYLLQRVPHTRHHQQKTFKSLPISYSPRSVTTLDIQSPSTHRLDPEFSPTNPNLKSGNYHGSPWLRATTVPAAATWAQEQRENWTPTCARVCRRR